MPVLERYASEVRNSRRWRGSVLPQSRGLSNTRARKAVIYLAPYLLIGAVLAYLEWRHDSERYRAHVGPLYYVAAALLWGPAMVLVLLERR